MSLLKNINKSIEKTIVQFTKEVSEKYGMPQDEILEMWTTISKMKIKSVSSSTKKMSPWLQFCKDERIKLKKDQPSLKFGEISKVIGEKWSAMSDDDKKKYESSVPVITNTTNITKNTNNNTEKNNHDESSNTTEENPSNDVIVPTKTSTTSTSKKTSTTTTNAKKPVVSKSPTTTTTDPAQWTRDHLEKMSISELKELCEGIKLSKTGKKSEIVNRLLNCSDTGVGLTQIDEEGDEMNDNASDVSETEPQCAFNYDYSSD